MLEPDGLFRENSVRLQASGGLTPSGETQPYSSLSRQQWQNAELNGNPFHTPFS
jgi:hypothetical protein